MTIFGRQVSVAVLLSGLLGLGLTAVGLIQNIITGWRLSDPQGDYLLISGVVTSLVNAAVHTWDTMPGNAATPTKTTVVKTTTTTEPVAVPPPPAAVG